MIKGAVTREAKVVLLTPNVNVPCAAVKYGLSSCPATDRECKSCGNKGHYKSVCKKRSPTPGPNQNTKADSKNVKCSTARCGRVKIIEAEDDNEPTPLCQMTFETEKGRKFSSEVLPDTGCSQSIIARDMANENGMIINKSEKKTIRNASNEKMNCEGTVDLSLIHI